MRWVSPKQLADRALQVGDVVLEASGVCGRSYVVREVDLLDNPIPISFSNFSRRLVPNGRVNPSYLGYRLKQAYESEEIASYITGTAMPNLDVRSALAGLRINLPPLSVQREIASILGAFDDKIELNRRMSYTLEAMARALFQSWFVDFDPVHAKAEGRQPVGMDAETAALFPDSFEDSVLGPIPKGWSAGNMGNVTKSRREKVGSEDAQVLSAVTTGKLINSTEYFNKQVFSASITNYLVVRQWDFAYNPSRINIGSIGLLEEDVIGAVSPVYEVLTPSRSLHWFVEKSLRLSLVQDQIKVLSSGSVRQSLKPSDFKSIQIVIPSIEVVHAYNRFWELQRSKILSLGNENSVLVSVRDALLPMLLSGELRAGDVAA